MIAPLLILLASLAAPLAVPLAQAAGFDCAAAASRTERLICANPALSAADSELSAALGAALAASPHPQTVRIDQRRWIASARDKSMSPADLLQLYRTRTAALRAVVAERAVMDRALDGGMPASCVPLIAVGGSCAVAGSGELDPPGGPRLRWRIQRWSEGGQTLAEGVMVFSGEGATTRLLTWAAEEGAVFDPPALITTAWAVLLDLPGHKSGSGNFSAESLFVLREGAWREVDISVWLDQMEARLPRGLGAWKGIFPDWAKMTADTPLWRQGDGNCCPTGGAAHAVLRLDGDRITLVTLQRDNRP